MTSRVLNSPASTKLPIGLLLGLILPLLCACQSTLQPAEQPAGDDPIRAVWVIVGDRGAVARAATASSVCPAINIDGEAKPMLLRVAADHRGIREDSAAAHPAIFPVATCEYPIPARAEKISVGRHALPALKTDIQRIVVIGDTGCRLKASGNAWQSCNDKAQWPFAQISALGAQLKPDLVVHLGDMHYRESPCPINETGCQGSPWGFGWDTWNIDFFDPAASLLNAAPWVVVRGNHEECERAGQGWFRFLDPAAFAAERSCNEPAKDQAANYSSPYAVPLGANAQFIVFDSATAGHAAINTGKPADVYKLNAYQAQFRTVGELASRPNVNSFFLSHHPVLGLAVSEKGEIFKGNVPLLTAMKALHGTSYFPPGITASFHGHSHLFEAMNFSSGHPATILAGHGGTALDPEIPDPLPPSTSPAEEVSIESITHGSHFGLLLMERQGAEWRLAAMDRTGRTMATCTLAGSKVRCDKTGTLR